MHPAIRIALDNLLESNDLSYEEQRINAGRLIVVARELRLPMPDEELVPLAQKASLRVRAARLGSRTPAGQKLLESAHEALEALGSIVISAYMEAKIFGSNLTETPAE